MLKGNGVLQKQPQPNQQPLQPSREHLRWETAQGTSSGQPPWQSHCREQSELRAWYLAAVTTRGCVLWSTAQGPFGPSLGKAAATTRGSQDWCMLSIMRSASSMICRRQEAEVSFSSRPGPPSKWATYQEAEVLEAESWGLVDMVHQAARGGHHDVGQAAEAICSVGRGWLSRVP